ncbi:MAG: hypothetical protein ABJC09_05430 [Terriglobia bacterium]
MRHKEIYWALSLQVSTCSLSAWQKTPDIDQILTRVQTNLAAFDAALPDFVANEKVVSKNVVGGIVRQRRETESLFTCVRAAGEAGSRLIETREVLAVDGKPVKKGRKAKGPYLFGGAVASLLHGTFSVKTSVFQKYKFAGEETLDGRRVFDIAFATKDGQTGLALMVGSKRIFPKDSGRALVDPESMQVLRLERTFTGLPNSTEITLIVDYSAVTIEGKSLLLPKTVTSERREIGSKPPRSRTYTAEYSGYRKFSVDTAITYH